MMDEAYTIGIRLALEDGVSTGIALIGRDLEKLDGAIGQTTEGLVRLADVARATLAGVAATVRAPRVGAVAAESKLDPEVPVREAPSKAPLTPTPRTIGGPVAPAPIQPTPEAVAAPLPPRAALPDTVPASVVHSAGEQPAAAPARVPEAARATPLPRPAMTAAAPERSSPERPVSAMGAPGPAVLAMRPGVIPTREPLSPERPPAARADAGRRDPVAATSAVTIALRQERSTPNAPPASAGTARAVSAPAPAAASATTTRAAPAHSARAAAAAEIVRQAESGAPRTRAQSSVAALPQKAAPQRAESARLAIRAPMAPATHVVPGSVAVPAPSRPWSPAGSPIAPAAPPARQTPPMLAQVGSEPERSESNIYLDGELVGRWLVERLGRDASRPPTGTSGIDGRLSPAWFPGAMQ